MIQTLNLLSQKKWEKVVDLNKFEEVGTEIKKVIEDVAKLASEGDIHLSFLLKPV